MALKRLRPNGGISTQLGAKGGTGNFREDSFGRVTEMEAWHHSTPKSAWETKQKQLVTTFFFFQKLVEKGVTAKTKGPEFFNKIQLCL